jgi:hypothetical protein
MYGGRPEYGTVVKENGNKMSKPFKVNMNNGTKWPKGIKYTIKIINKYEVQNVVNKWANRKPLQKDMQLPRFPYFEKQKKYGLTSQYFKTAGEQ